MPKRKKATQEWPLHAVVEVEWVDTSVRQGWDTVEDYADHSMIECISVGYILRKSDEQIVLLNTQGRSNDNAGNQAIAIPMGCVTKVTVLRK